MTRLGWIILAALGSGALLPRPTPRLIWNASASVPIGLYAVRPAGVLHLGELVLVRPPETLASFLQERGYLAAGVPLLKHVLGLSGQSVCRFGRTISVDETVMGDALDRDQKDRTLPVWNGCRTVGANEVFLMNRQSASSFDGRYFGLLPVSTIVGRVSPIWIEKN